MVLAAIGSIIFVLPWFILTLFPLVYLFYSYQQASLNVSRVVKRLFGVTKSPLYSHLTSSLLGLSSIRSFQSEERSLKRFHCFNDRNNSTWILFLGVSRWLGVRLDSLAATLMGFSCFFCVLFQTTISPGLAGVIIQQAMSLAGVLQWCVRQAAETENCLTAVERIDYFRTLEPEDPLLSAYASRVADLTRAVIEPDQCFPSGRRSVEEEPSWPSTGTVEFKNVTMSYRFERQIKTKSIERHTYIWSCGVLTDDRGSKKLVYIYTYI